MNRIKRTLGVMLVCLMLMGMLSIGVFAEDGSLDNPINANDKWFGNGANCFLINTTLTAGDTDGVWYTLTADKNGILQLEHSSSALDYYLTVEVNGILYKSHEDGIYTRPIATYPVKKGDVATIHIIAQNTAQGGTVYANAKFISGENSTDQSVKVKSAGTKVWVAAGSTVYYQDDSTNALYAAKGAVLSGDSVQGITFYTVANSTSGTTSQKGYTDTDGDGTIELTMGGSLGGSGAPPTKPSWAIENNSDEDRCFILTLTGSAHECVGAASCLAGTCSICGTVSNGKGAHTYDSDTDTDCNACGAVRVVEYTLLTFDACSASADVQGLAFLFETRVSGMKMVNNANAVYTNATVIPNSAYGACKLVSMGAVMSNDPTATLVITNDNGGTIRNVPAVYLTKLTVTTAQFAVRIVNIPRFGLDMPIFARPYCIYEKNGVQVIDYGDVVSNTYNNVL